jgi:hypothetical protein
LYAGLANVFLSLVITDAPPIKNWGILSACQRSRLKFPAQLEHDWTKYGPQEFNPVLCGINIIIITQFFISFKFLIHYFEEKKDCSCKNK